MNDLVHITGIRPGLQVRGLDQGQTPIADYLCGHCHAHKRVTGRAEVTEFTATDPAADHATRCDPATSSQPTAA